MKPGTPGMILQANGPGVIGMQEAVLAQLFWHLDIALPLSACVRNMPSPASREAMIVGCQVVSSNVGPMVELATDAAASFVRSEIDAMR